MPVSDESRKRAGAHLPQVLENEERAARSIKKHMRVLKSKKEAL